MARPLPARFFDRPSLQVAPALIGARLVHEADGVRYVARIVEVEAYVGDGTDPGAHGHGGMTPRNRVMFGPPGHLYVYRSYGMHTCANVVTERDGACAAVLLRAVEPLEGLEQMIENRGGRRGPELTNGPGKLCAAMAITLEHYGRSVVSGPLHFLADPGPAPRVAVSTRIGLSKGKEHPWRFFDADSPWVGRPRVPLRVLRRR
jgi:DNA-3-methyladenine glycosylase